MSPVVHPPYKPFGPWSCPTGNRDLSSGVGWSMCLCGSRRPSSKVIHPKYSDLWKTPRMSLPDMNKVEEWSERKERSPDP